MKVKIAEIQEIKSGEEAMDRVRDWLNKYSEERNDGHRYKFTKVDVRKEEDGWYAITNRPPEPILEKIAKLSKAENNRNR